MAKQQYQPQRTKPISAATQQAAADETQQGDNAEQETQQTTDSSESGTTEGTTAEAQQETQQTDNSAPQVEQSAPVNQVKENAHMGVISTLTSYYEAMKPGKAIDPKVGGVQQLGLWRAIRSVLNLDQENFNARYSAILSFAHDHAKDVFNEAYVYRFPEHWAGTENEFTNFRRVVHVIIATANPKTRAKGLKEINFDKAFEGLTEEEKSKLISYYNL